MDSSIDMAVTFGGQDLELKETYILNGQKHEKIIKLDSINLNTGNLEKKYFQWWAGKVDLSKPHPSHALIRTLMQRGMPIDIPIWSLAIDGAGVKQPQYNFHFIGVQIQDSSKRPDAVSPMLLKLGFVRDDHKVDEAQLGFVWESRVLLKETESLLTEYYDPRIKGVPMDKHYFTIQHISAQTPPEGRAAIMRRLATGYDAMVKLLGSLVSRPIKYPPQEAMELREKILNEAKPILRQWARQPMRSSRGRKSLSDGELRIEPLAKAIKRGKQTLYDVNAANIAANQSGLIEVLNDFWKAEVESVQESKKRLIPS
jgi:hypothetical protein